MFVFYFFVIKTLIQIFFIQELEQKLDEQDKQYDQLIQSSVKINKLNGKIILQLINKSKNIDEQNEQLINKSQTIDELKEQIVKQDIKLINKSNTIDELNGEIVNQSKKIDQLQNIILGTSKTNLFTLLYKILKEKYFLF